MSADYKTLSFGSGILREIPISQILADISKQADQPHSYDGVFENGGGEYRLIFDYANGRYDASDDSWEYFNYTGWLLLK